MEKILASFREILAGEPKAELGKVPVRFIGIGQYSLDVEVNVYIKTSDGDEFLELQQKLLLEMLQSVERAGTGLALPWHQSAPSSGSASEEDKKKADGLGDHPPKTTV